MPDRRPPTRRRTRTGAQVGEGGAEAGGDLDLVGPEQGAGKASAQLGVVAGMAAGEIGGVALGRQLFGTVLAERLEQSERSGVTKVGKDHGLVDERRQHVDDIVAERPPARDRIGSFDVEVAGEDRQPPERRTFVVIEQSPAPVERRAQRLVPLDSPVASRREDVEVLIEARRQLG